MSRLRFPIVAYLNQGVVFDLIAMLEGGIANIAAVKTTDNREATSSSSLDAKLGASNVFSLFGIGLSAKGDRSTRSGGITERSEERVYTPNSLFDKLRLALYEQDVVRTLDLGEDHEAGDFVEFSARLSKNPLEDAMEQLGALGELIATITRVSNPQQRQKKPPVPVAADSPFDVTMKMVATFSKMFHESETTDLVANTNFSHNAVLSLEKKFIDPAALGSLIDGEFQVFGKVLRRYIEGESVELLRGSPIRIMPDHVLTEFTDNLNATAKEIQFNLPRINTSVPGPALLVSPIAIFT